MQIRPARPETLSDVLEDEWQWAESEPIGLSSLPVHAIGGLFVLLGLAILAPILAALLSFGGGSPRPVFVPGTIPPPAAATIGR